MIRNESWGTLQLPPPHTHTPALTNAQFLLHFIDITHIMPKLTTKMAKIERTWAMISL